MEQFFEWMQVRNYAGVDRHDAAGATGPLHRLGGSQRRHPAHAKSPSRSSNATSGSCSTTANRNGNPLSFQTQNSRRGGDPGMVQVAGPQQPRPLQPGRRHRIQQDGTPAAEVRPDGERSGAGHQPNQRHHEDGHPGPGHPGDLLFDGDAADGTDEPAPVRHRHGAGHGRYPAGQGEEGPDDPHWRPGAWLDRPLPGRGPAGAVGRRQRRATCCS